MKFRVLPFCEIISLLEVGSYRQIPGEIDKEWNVINKFEGQKLKEWTQFFKVLKWRWSAFVDLLPTQFQHQYLVINRDQKKCQIFDVSRYILKTRLEKMFYHFRALDADIWFDENENTVIYTENTEPTKEKIDTIKEFTNRWVNRQQATYTKDTKTNAGEDVKAIAALDNEFEITFNMIILAIDSLLVPYTPLPKSVCGGF